MLFDSAFLIHASGQRGRKQQVAAENFLRANLDAPLYPSRVCWAEFGEGCAAPADVEAGLHLFTVVEIDESIAWTASRVARELKPRAGISVTMTPGLSPPLWPTDCLVSRNARHFARVTKLQVVAY